MRGGLHPLEEELDGVLLVIDRNDNGKLHIPLRQYKLEDSGNPPAKATDFACPLANERNTNGSTINRYLSQTMCAKIFIMKNPKIE
jgi:hypothetical protein